MTGSLAPALVLETFSTPDLGRVRRRDAAAKRIGKQLVAEADAEIRPPHVRDPFADGLLLGNEPGIFVLLPHVLRAAHHHHEVEGIEARDGFALVEFDGVRAKAVLLKEVAKDTGVLDAGVLKNEQVHWISCLWDFSTPDLSSTSKVERAAGHQSQEQ